jgi:putative transposase
LINRQKLIDLLGVGNDDQLITYHRHWIEDLLKNDSDIRDSKWTESIAVGDKEFVLKTQDNLEAKAIGRNVVQNNGIYELRGSQTPYNSVFDPEKCALSQKNSYFWNLSFENTGG